MPMLQSRDAGVNRETDINYPYTAINRCRHHSSIPQPSRKGPRAQQVEHPQDLVIRASQGLVVRATREPAIRASQHVPIRASQHLPIRASQRLPIRASQDSVIFVPCLPPFPLSGCRRSSWLYRRGLNSCPAVSHSLQQLSPPWHSRGRVSVLERRRNRRQQGGGLLQQQRRRCLRLERLLAVKAVE